MSDAMRLAAVVVAAGRGLRAGGEVPKQWREVGGRTVLDRTIAALRAHAPVTLVLAADDPRAGEIGGVAVVTGGETRSASVRAALEALAAAGEATHVLIHDGARPLVPAPVIEGVIAALRAGAQGAAPGLPLTDALWRTDAGRVTGTAPRTGLMRAQTPQGFALDAILAAHRAGPPEGAEDDVTLALQAGLHVVATAGADDNIKLTHEADFARAEAILARGGGMVRMGQGFDVHAFGPGDHVVLCGLRIAHDRGLVGHSDADVGLHALTDAVLGAVALGDIGRHFPPSDPRWKGAESGQFLRHAIALAARAGWQVGNLDLTLICEAPKIGPHAAAMTAQVAAICGCAPEAVSVKATTTERLGFTGRNEGIAALASACMLRA